MSDERLRELYAEGLDARAGRREGCPRPEAIRDLVNRAGAEDERMALLDHVMSCGACRREFDLLRAIAAAEAEEEPARPIPGPFVRFALAASVIGLLAVGSIWQASRPAGTVFRGSEGVVVPVHPVGSVSDVDSLLWTSAAQEATYEVEIVDELGAVVYAGATSDTTLALPPTVTLRPGMTYVWTLRTITLEEGRRAVSVEFRLR